MEISGFYSTLIAIVTRERQYYEAGEGESLTELQLAHSSVKAYLTSRSESQCEGSFSEYTARATMVETCLAYLLELDGSESTKQLHSYFPLAHFTAQHWASHATVVSKRSRKVHNLAIELFFS